jgi:hypothetical protein
MDLLNVFESIITSLLYRLQDKSNTFVIIKLEFERFIKEKTSFSIYQIGFS